MFTKIFAAAAFAAALSAATIAPDAQAAPWGNDNWQRHGDSHVSEVNHRRHKTVKRTIDRRVKNTTLPLRRLLGLDRDFNGYRINAVVVEVRPVRKRSRVALLVNGHAVDGEVVRGRETVRLRLDDDRIIGRDLKSLKLDVRGKVYIRDIKVKMTRVPPRRHTQRDDVRDQDRHQVDARAIERIARLILRQINRSAHQQWAAQ